ncbi:MAG: PKD domain-containing protein [Candidatus Zixiibacteriota bacterium]|nr:MAG: PKD domain-containing protein [candidate division Zixibacteria bacterium]
MGYGPQTCRVEFSPQQMARMHCWIQDQLTPYLVQVTLDADTTFGPVPLTVNFTGFSPKTVNGWTWDFGDGQISHLQNPTHTYSQAGAFDVSLTIDAADGSSFTTNQAAYIYATADTLVVDSVTALPGQTVRVDVSVNNELPLTRVTVPFTWLGPLGLTFDSVSTEGLRTSFLTLANGGIFVTNNDFNNRRAIRELLPGAANPIAPGTGPILSLYFTAPPFQLPGSNPIDLISYGLRDPSLEVIPGPYLPAIVQGAVAMTCCQGNVGNVDADPNDVTDVADLTALINHLFISFQALPCQPEANCNGDPDNNVDISDLTALIDHLFINFSALPACQ